MSGLGPDVVREAHDLLHDQNYASPVVSDDALRQAVNRNISIMAGELGIGPLWISGAIMTNTADYDYPLPSGVEYEQVINFVYARDRWPLVKISRDECLISRAGSQNSIGRQFSYALSVTPDQGVVVNFPGRPSVPEAIDAYVSTMPKVWNADDETPPTIPFAERALRALALLVAEDAGRTLSADRITALQLSPAALDQFHAQAMELIRLERLTIIRLKRAQGPKNYGWFASWWR